MEYFKKWYVISLTDSDTSGIEKNTKEAKIKNVEIIRYKGAKKRTNTPENTSIGNLLNHTSFDETAKNILQNHKATIQKAIYSGIDNVVIMEDDCRFDLPIDQEKIQHITEWLSKHEWDIFFFGHCPWPLPISFMKSRHVVKPMTPMLGHCYALSKNGMKIILDEIDRHPNMQIDKVFGVSDRLRKYAIFPSIAHQCVSPSIYRDIMSRSGLSEICFRNVTTFLEYTSVLLPLLGVIILMGCVLMVLRRKKSEKIST